jgi:hypothetical protein
MLKNSEIVKAGIPNFKITAATIADEFKMKSLSLPSKANICSKALNRANGSI